MFGLKKKVPSVKEVEARVRESMMDADPASPEYKNMAAVLVMLEGSRTRKGEQSWAKVFIRYVLPALISGGVTIGGIWMMLEYEKEGHIGSKSLPFIPKPKF